MPVDRSGRHKHQSFCFRLRFWPVSVRGAHTQACSREKEVWTQPQRAAAPQLTILLPGAGGKNKGCDAQVGTDVPAMTRRGNRRLARPARNPPLVRRDRMRQILSSASISGIFFLAIFILGTADASTHFDGNRLKTLTTASRQLSPWESPANPLVIQTILNPLQGNGADRDASPADNDAVVDQPLAADESHIPPLYCCHYAGMCTISGGGCASPSESVPCPCQQN